MKNLLVFIPLLVNCFAYCQQTYIKHLGGGDIFGELKQLESGDFFIVGSSCFDQDNCYYDGFWIQFDSSLSSGSTRSIMEYDSVWSGKPSTEISDFALTPDGGFILTGTTTPGENSAYIKMLLLKLNSAGDVNWVRSFSFPGEYPYVNKISVMPDGSYAIQVGTTIVKMDSAGTPLWAKKIPADHEIKMELFGSTIIVSGNIYNQLFLLALDEDANLLWSKLYLYDEMQYPLLYLNQEKNFIITGYNNNSPFKYQILKTDSSGNILWGKRFKRTDDDFGFEKIVEDRWGNEVFLGGVWSQWTSLTFDSTGKFISSIMIPAYGDVNDATQSRDSNLVTLMTTWGDYTYGILVKTNPIGYSGCNDSLDYPVVQNFYLTTEDFVPSLSADNMPVEQPILYTVSPIKKWESTISCDHTCLLSPAIVENGNSLSCSFTADSYQWLDGNMNPIPGATSQDFSPQQSGNYFVQITNNDSCRGISLPFNITFVGSDDPALSDIQVFPNPFTSQFMIQNLSAGSAFKIFDAIGRLVEERRDASGDVTAGENLFSGFYLLQVNSSDGRRWSIKIIKE